MLNLFYVTLVLNTRTLPAVRCNKTYINSLLFYNTTTVSNNTYSKGPLVCYMECCDTQFDPRDLISNMPTPGRYSQGVTEKSSWGVTCPCLYIKKGSRKTVSR